MALARKGHGGPLPPSRGWDTRPSARARDSPECWIPMLATLRGRVRGRRPHGERPLYGGGSRVARNAAFWAREVGLWPKSQGIPWNSW
jgi:hypothetical protein